MGMNGLPSNVLTLCLKDNLMDVEVNDEKLIYKKIWNKIPDFF